MATKETCDLCGEPAVDRITIGSKTVLTVGRDVCEEHLLLFKKSVHFFTGQADLPLVIENIKVEIVEPEAVG